MDINELLKLDKVSASIKKIDLFLSKTSKSDAKYYEAIAYKGIIFGEIGRVNEALKLLYSYVPIFNQLDYNAVIYLCNAIIEISKKNFLVDQMAKYIEVKKNYLPLARMNEYYMDLIDYYILTNNQAKIKEEIFKILAEETDVDIRAKYMAIIADIYFKEHDYERFLSYYDNLFSYYNKNLLFDKANELSLKKIRIEYESGSYIKAIEMAKALLSDEHLSSELKINAAAICVRGYLKNKEYRRATIIVTDYEDELDNIKPIDGKEFVLAALDLYKEQNHLISIKEYEDRLNKINSSIEYENPKKKKNKQIIIPEIAETIVEEPKQNVAEINVIKNEKTDILVSEAYEKFADVFSYINSRDKNLKFREFFRLGAIELTKLFPIDEIVIVYYNQGYFGYHYKVERVYNKAFNNKDLEDTVLLTAIEQETDVYKEDEGLKNIITNLPYEEKKYILCFPFFEDTIIMGSIAYISNKRFIDVDMAYEILKLTSQMLNVRLNNEMYINEIETTNKKLFFISEAMSSGIKVEASMYVHSNAKACEILDIYENLNVSDYESRIAANDLIAYRKAKEEALANEALDVVSKYHFHKGNEIIYVKERFYPMLENKTYTLISLIDDITADEKTKNDLEALIYENPLSKLSGEAKLFIDLTDAIKNKKFSIALIDINDFKLYTDIYGLAFTSQLIYHLGLVIKEEIATDFNTRVYHLDGDKFALLYNELNDKRLALSKTINYLDKLTKKMYDVNKRIKLSFAAGVYRYTANQNISDPSKILNYASYGLLDAKEVKDGQNHVALFDQRNYQKRYFDFQLITHISECIDHNKMKITYKQIIDLNEKNVYAYFARLNLVNYDVDYQMVDKVIKRRSLEDLLDKYLIQQSLMELKNFYNMTHAYLKICIPIHKKTIEDEKIISFVLTQLDFFKIPKGNVIFYVDESINKDVMISFINSDLELATNQMECLFLDSLKILFLSYKKYNDSYKEILDIALNKKITIITDDIDTKDDLLNAKKMSLNYIYGEYYKKNVTMNELISKVNMNN